MYPLEDMTLWSLEDVEAAVLRNLTPGLRFRHGWDTEAGVWFAAVLNVDAEGTETTAFMDWGADHRTLLFDVLGWFWRQQRSQGNTAWTRNRETTRERPGPVRFVGGSAPDPEDLDPDQIASVYDGSRTSK